MAKIKSNLDSIIADLDEAEARNKNNIEQKAPSKTLIGVVMQFYEKISVAAIKLEDSLDTGDIIEIGTDEEAIRQCVESIEINRKSVEHAEKGDNIGIKLKWRVNKDDKVYKLVTSSNK